MEEQEDQDGTLLVALDAIADVCTEAFSSIDDRLLACELAWLVFAGIARSEALAFPGGFPGEQARQVERLEKMVGLVRDDAPDLELERLFQEGNVEEIARRLRAALDEGTSDEGA